MIRNLACMFISFTLSQHLFAGDNFVALPPIEDPTTMHPYEMHRRQGGFMFYTNQLTPSIYRGIDPTLAPLMSPTSSSLPTQSSSSSSEPTSLPLVTELPSPDLSQSSHDLSIKIESLQTQIAQIKQEVAMQSTDLATMIEVCRAFTAKQATELAVLTKNCTAMLRKQNNLEKTLNECSGELSLLSESQSYGELGREILSAQTALLKQFEQQFSERLTGRQRSSFPTSPPAPRNDLSHSMSSSSSSSSSRRATTSRHFLTNDDSDSEEEEEENDFSQTSSEEESDDETSTDLPEWRCVYDSFSKQPPKKALDTIAHHIGEIEKFKTTKSQKHMLSLLHMSRARFNKKLYEQGECQYETLRQSIEAVDPKTFKGRALGTYKELLKSLKQPARNKRQRT